MTRTKLLIISLGILIFMPQGIEAQLSYSQGRLSIGPDFGSGDYDVRINGPFRLYWNVYDPESMFSDIFGIWLDSSREGSYIYGTMEGRGKSFSGIYFQRREEHEPAPYQTIVVSKVYTELTEGDGGTQASPSKMREFLSMLSPVSYRYVEGGDRVHFGFVAQELEKVLPEAVHTVEGSDTRTISQTDLLPLLVGAIQDVNSIVDANEETLSVLESKVKPGIISHTYDAGAKCLVLDYILPFDRDGEIYVTDFKGNYVSSIKCPKGSSRKQVFGLSKGIYIASLMTDNAVISSVEIIVK